MHILHNKVGCHPWVVAGDSLAAATQRIWRQIQNSGGGDVRQRGDEFDARPSMKAAQVWEVCLWRHKHGKCFANSHLCLGPLGWSKMTSDLCKNHLQNVTSCCVWLANWSLRKFSKVCQWRHIQARLAPGSPPVNQTNTRHLGPLPLTSFTSQGPYSSCFSV